MNIGIMGTGTVAQTLGHKLASLGHEVVYGTRDVAATMMREEAGDADALPWKQDTPHSRLGTFEEAAIHGELVINATSGQASLAALAQGGKDNLSGKILIDVSNPLDFSQGFPPTLSVCNTDSLGEQIQRAFPETRVVKTLNTLTASLMVAPEHLPGDHNLFLGGNDVEAKRAVTRYLGEWFGWKLQNIIDLGDITTARGTEMILPIWVRLYGALQHPMFNFHIVTAPQEGE